MTPNLRGRTSAIARELHARGWVANHDGNVTVRDNGRYLATPTATSKRLIGDRDLIELDSAGKVVGSGKVFGEIGLHLTVYQRRPDIGAVVHAHPPHATAIACARGGVADHLIARPFIAEAVVSLGPIIPRLPFAVPGEPSVAALAPWCEEVDAVLLGGHGVMAWGADVEVAFLRLELVEHLARIALTAQPIGGVEPLPAAAIPPLLAARAKAGIGRAADKAIALAADLDRRPPDGDGSRRPPDGSRSSSGGSTSGGSTSGGAQRPAAGTAARPVIACAPAPHSDVVTTASRPSGADLAAIVREEIVRALRGS